GGVIAGQSLVDDHADLAVAGMCAVRTVEIAIELTKDLPHRAVVVVVACEVEKDQPRIKIPGAAPRQLGPDVVCSLKLAAAKKHFSELAEEQVLIRAAEAVSIGGEILDALMLIRVVSV